MKMLTAADMPAVLNVIQPLTDALKEAGLRSGATVVYTNVYLVSRMADARFAVRCKKSLVRDLADVVAAAGLLVVDSYAGGLPVLDDKDNNHAIVLFNFAK
jgi:hypothetical protein